MAEWYEKQMKKMFEEAIVKTLVESSQAKCSHDWDNSIGVALTNPPQPMRRCKKCKKTEYYSYDGHWR